MSDSNRKDFSTQVTEKMTPDHEKTTGERIKEKLTGGIDRMKAALTPDSKKSIPQQMGDKTRGSSDQISNNPDHIYNE
jgi:hypothetical protein